MPAFPRIIRRLARYAAGLLVALGAGACGESDASPVGPGGETGRGTAELCFHSGLEIAQGTRKDAIPALANPSFVAPGAAGTELLTDADPVGGIVDAGGDSASRAPPSGRVEPGSRGARRLLVLADDWCEDAVNTLPGIARLAEAAPNLELRVLGREEIPEIMDRHLTGTSRSIPVVILLDEQGEERGWWGPRPRSLQAWFEEVGRPMDKADRYRELRRWYARDRGKTTAGEIAELVWCGAWDNEAYRGTRPCASARAA